MGGLRVINEADTSNNRAVMESLNSANSPQPEPTNCPFYAVVPSENLAIRQLPLLKPAEEKQQESPNPQSTENVTQEEWVAEPDRGKQAVIDDEFQKLLVLNEELRAANNELYEQVEHLKDDLAESEKALQWQKRRSSVTESMLNQQAQELIAAQEQIQSLFQQLDTTTQTVQRQETLIETYKAQLQISQQRLAQLERECALLQTNYHEQSQQVLQSETTCRELRTRLMRQQRQTLQFKAALEKCLEPPSVNDDSSEETGNNTANSTTKQSRFSRKARSLFPNVQPIRPWSAEPESPSENVAHSWGESSIPPASSHSNPAPQPSSPWNWPTKEETPAPTEPDTSAEIEDEPITSETVSSGESSAKLDEQIDTLIQMFFASQPGTSSVTSETNVTSNQSEKPLWETWATNEAQSETTLEQQLAALSTENNEPITVPSSVIEESTILPENNLPISFTVPLTNKTTEAPENFWLETTPENTEELPETELSEETTGDYSNDPQSPSPVVYPQRPPKGRKSLASVELPNFRPNSQI
ncbi:hypothetical protein [Nostoc sp. PCC 7107]|uniref:hypothetical protein n=1 Tax=Nostoc sp. PCC 7107 TaxID=317936 RepID=UPI00029F0C31|nr:hypothetical protein [Nostoc sp. PCC 7107]AFY41964.1 hypothetical protein Nos7107_1317 [Nostoc sp. PCC 7107]